MRGSLCVLIASAATAAIFSMVAPVCAQVGGPSNDDFKADVLYTACNPPAETDQATRGDFRLTCEMYFRGLTDGMTLMKWSSDAGKRDCLPTQVPIPTSEAESEFKLFLLDHPEAGQNSAALVAFFAIMHAHPCS